MERTQRSAPIFRPSSMENTAGKHNNGELERNPKEKVTKNPKAKQRRNQPRRGVGVAELERRIRLQEQWKLMKKQINNPVTPPLPNFQHPSDFQFAIPYFNPNNQSVPESFGEGLNALPLPVHFDGFGDDCNAAAANLGGYSSYGFRNDGFVPDSATNLVPNGGYEIIPVVEESRFQSFNNYQYVEQPAKELPSIQMTHCFSENCVFCFKNAERLAYKPMNGYDSLGYCLCYNNVDDNSSGLDRYEGVEMNTVHPQRNVVKEENELTEYEFFSSSASSSNCSGSSWLNRDRDSSSVLWGGEASGSASPTTPTTHFLDLSLRLSC
ncbi:hypothetical protein ACHQM5_024394 [Ranunculus cassubicifolius]